MFNIKQKHLKLLALTLAIVGLGSFFYKYWRLDLPLVPQSKQSVWTVEAQLTFTPGRNSVKADLFVPAMTENFSILNEYFVSPNYSVTTTNVGDNRVSVWAKRKASGNQTLFYRVQVARDDNGRPDVREAEQDSVSKPLVTGAQATAITALVSQIRESSADVATFATALVDLLNHQQQNNNAALLLGTNPDPLKIANTAVTVLAGASIPAQVVHGLYLRQDETSAHIVPWLEVWNGQKWLYINPLIGKLELPTDFFIWWRGDQPLFEVAGAKQPKISFTISHAYLDALTLAQQQTKVSESKLMNLSLFNLPLETQQVYQQLLTIPIGVFIILLLRSFIGIKTFGTFMPVLIALSFRETQLLLGLGFFSIIVACGLLVRFYLDQFKLLLVPRLAGVLIVVILLMTGISLITYKLGILSGLSVALFPMVILTMTIERMSITWEERGPAEAIQQGIGSLLTACIAFLAMKNTYLNHLVFVFPEILFVLLAVTLLIGRYQGYRLLELIRFQSLVEMLERDKK